ncbi:unnamed protein product [Brassica napus]|uniref:(rape) hypothetical protein n=1 Tax=Brassica napus TaxID=3708 RepID=A0A816RB76_BRANA|nr:unnamed protein product [Brassica napus]
MGPVGFSNVWVQYQITLCAAIVPKAKHISVLYIKIRRFSGEIELKYLIGKTLMEPLSNASAEKSLATRF